VPDGALEPASRPEEIPAPWLAALWHALAREEEREDPRRDQWSCYSGTFTRLGTIGLLETPFVNRAAARLRERLDAWCRDRHAELERVPRWKNGAPFAAALSHDVDDVRLRSVPQALRLMSTARSLGGYAVRGGLSALARAIVPSSGVDPYAQFERWATEESRRGFRSTFYVVARPRRAHEYDPLYRLDDPVPFEDSRPTVGSMFRALAERGFEIGLHGSYGSWRDEQRLTEERRSLAAATGGEISGIRQHFLRFDLERTWGAQERAGFTADATLGYNEAVGFRAGLAAPFHPWDRARGRGHALIEVPLTLMDGALFRGLGLRPEEARRRTLAHLEAVERVGGMAGLLWHPNAAAEALFPGWWSCYIAALDHLAARGAWVASVGEIGAWWRERERRLHGGES
jgi:peptidoglycan/xylan/chitin deacetylase (PgdA/CDA1 family)